MIQVLVKVDQAKGAQQHKLH